LALQRFSRHRGAQAESCALQPDEKRSRPPCKEGIRQDLVLLNTRVLTILNIYELANFSSG
jgi:hypothetical protein